MLAASAVFLESLGRLDEALALDEALVRRDPVNMSALYGLGRHQPLGRPARRGDRVVPHRAEPEPGLGGRVHYQLGVALLLKGDAQGALAEIEQEDESDQRMGLSMAYHALGRKADSDAALAALIAKDEKESSYNIAYVYAFRGEADKAFAWLDKAVEYGDTGLPNIVTE